MCNLSVGIYNRGREEGRHWGKLEMLFEMITEDEITMDKAAQKMHMERSLFEKEYRKYLQEVCVS